MGAVEGAVVATAEAAGITSETTGEKEKPKKTGKKKK
jgi:hypothetical protein